MHVMWIKTPYWSWFFWFLSSDNLASLIPRCARTVRDPGKCILEAVEKLRPNLARGDFGDGWKLPKIEPLYLTGLRFYRGPDVNCLFDDIYVRGASNFQVEKLK